MSKAGKPQENKQNKYIFWALLTVFLFSCGAIIFFNSPGKSPPSAPQSAKGRAQKPHPSKPQITKSQITPADSEDTSSPLVSTLPSKAFAKQSSSPDTPPPAITPKEKPTITTKLSEQIDPAKQQSTTKKKPTPPPTKMGKTQKKTGVKKTRAKLADKGKQQLKTGKTTIAKDGGAKNGGAKAQVTSLSHSESPAAKAKQANEATFTAKIKPETREVSGDYIETAFDLFVGGNYYGFVLVKYNDDWIELIDPQEAIYLLPLIRNRQEMLPLFQGRILASQEMDKIGSITIDNNNFAIMVDIAPEQALDVTLDIKKATSFEGSPTFLTRLQANGSRTLDTEDNETRYSIANNTRFAYSQHRILTSGTYINTESSYDLLTLQGETDFELFDVPLTGAIGLLDTPGQFFASSLNIVGVSVFSNRNRYSDDPLLNSNKLEVFVPTRSLVEVFKNNAENGQVLFSRMLDFGHTQLDTRSFPKGSYPVVIIISVDGVERSRYEEQFYKYEEIMPRERLDLNFSVGKFREDLDDYDVPVTFSSLRSRITDYLEGHASIYTIDDRLIFSQGVKGIYESIHLGEFNFEFTLSESSTKALLGYWINLHWKGDDISTSLSYSQGFEDEPIISDDLTVLDFKDREVVNFGLSRNFKLRKRSLNFTFKGQFRRSQDTEDSYRYGPAIRYTPYRNRNTSIMVTAQHDWTDSGSETRLFFGATYRLDTITASSSINLAKQSVRNHSNWQNSIQYQGNKNSPAYLRNITAKALYSVNRTDLKDNNDNKKTSVKNLNLLYEGSVLEAGVFLNKTSGEQRGNFGGEVISTFIAGSNNVMQMAGSVPIGSAIVAIRLDGQADSEKLISILVNGNHKAYMNIGETAFIEAPVYKTSKIEIRDANPKKGAFIKIIKPHTTVTPYPENILTRSFDIARLAIISGTLLNHDGTPVANLFFETGSEPAYTDSNGEFIIEMPIRANEKIFDFIVRNQLCTFEIPEVEGDMLIEVGKVKCQLANESELKVIRSIHDETRVY